MEAYEIAKQLYNTNQHQQALEKAQLILEGNQQHFEAQLLIGMIGTEQEDYMSAVKAYHQLLLINQDKAVVWKLLGMTYVKLREFKLAHQYLLRSLELDASDTQIYQQLGTINIYLRHYNSALQYLNRGLRYDQKNIRIYLTKAKLFYQMRQYDLSLRTYSIALQLDSNSGEAYRGMGEVHARKQNTQDAHQCYGKAIAINPMDIDSYFQQGVIQYRQNLLYVANISFDKALQLYPKHQEALNFYTLIQLATYVIPAQKQYNKLSIPQKMTKYYRQGRQDLVDYFHAQFYTLTHFINGYLNLDLSKDNTYYQKIHAMSLNAASVQGINNAKEIYLIVEFYDEIEQLLQMNQQQIKEKLDQWFKTVYEQKYKLIQLNQILAEQCLERSLKKKDFSLNENINLERMSKYTQYRTAAQKVALSDALNILIEMLH